MIKPITRIIPMYPLNRLGGFALFALLKTKSIYEKVLSILKNLHLPLNEKVDLPSNIQHLDKDGLTFMKKELLRMLHLQ